MSDELNLTAGEREDLARLVGASDASRVLAAADTLTRPPKGELTARPDPAVTGDGKYYTQVEDPRSSKLKRLTVQELEKLALDPQVALGVQMHVLPIQTLQPEFQHPVAEVAAFLNHELTRVSWSWLAREWLRALEFGFYASERVYEYRDTTIDLADGTQWSARAVVYEKLKGIHPSGVQLRAGERGEPLGFTQVAGGTADVPEDKALVFVHDEEFGNRYGNPITRRAFKYWWWSELIYQFANRYHEDQAIPPRKVFYEPNPQPVDPSDPSSASVDVNQAAALKVGEDSRAGAAAALPLQATSGADGGTEFKRSWDIEYLVGPEKTTAFTAYLDHLDAKKARALFVPERLAMQSGAGATGSYAMVDSLSEFFLMRVEAIAASAYRALVRSWARPLITYNFGAGVVDATLAAPKLSRDNRAFLQDVMRSYLGAVLGNPYARPPAIDVDALAQELGVPIVERGPDVTRQAPADPAPGAAAVRPMAKRFPVRLAAEPGIRPATNNRAWETATKAFQELLGDTYRAWARGTAARLAAASDAERDAVLEAALEDLRTLAVRAYREHLPGAFNTGYGDGATVESLSSLADRLASVERKIAEKTIPFLRDRVAVDVADHAAGGLDELALRLALEARAPAAITVPAGGEYWNTVVEGWIARRKEREADPNVDHGPLRWVLDSLASHCEDCPRYAGEYASISDLPAIPGDGSTQCGMNCRCWLEERGPDGVWQRRIHDL